MEENIRSPIAAALAAAQAELHDPERNKSGQVRGRSGYKYAGLDDLLRAIRPVLASHGLAITQRILVDGAPILSTELRHEGGEVLSSCWPLSWTGGPQERGSELTYARRYTLEALVGVAATDDDDADTAQRTPTPTAAPSPSPSPAPPRKAATREQIAFLAALSKVWPAGAAHGRHLAAWLAAQGRPRPTAMTEPERAALLDWLSDTDHQIEVMEWSPPAGDGEGE